MNFGKNIKKIRSIKKLSQTAFAEIFELKRSSIGAYEEGRAEPKLEIIIKIAKYFSISVDSLVNSEMTVNKLYNFHLFDEYLQEGQYSENEKLKQSEIVNIPLVSTKDIVLKSLEQVIKDSQSHISLLGLNNKQLAILIDENSFNHLPKQIVSNDIIIIGTELELNTEVNLTDKLWLVKSKNTVSIGEVKRINKEELLFIDPNMVPVVLQKKELDYMFSVDKHVSSNPRVGNSETDRIRKLELMINDLYNRI